MKILYFDCVYYPGHLGFDSSIISCLAESAEEMVVIQPDNWFSVNVNTIRYINRGIPKRKTKRFGRFITWKISVLNVLHSLPIIRKEKPDVVIIGEYELLTFSFVFPLLYFYCKRIVIIHHNNIDQLTHSRIKRILFSLYKNRVYSCVLEPFIKEYLEHKYEIAEDHVICWPHPIKGAPSKLDINSMKKYSVIGISNSNDEELIANIIELEKELNVFKNNQIRIILKSKTTEYDDGYLTIINGWISDDEYNDYYNNAHSVFVAFPSSYQYRVSATLLDAIKRKTPIIGSDSMMMDYYHSAYPNICKIYNPQTFIDDIKAYSIIDETMEGEFNRFMRSHSNEYIINQIKNDLFNITNSKLVNEDKYAD